jgi:hypothetical protein
MRRYAGSAGAAQGVPEVWRKEYAQSERRKQMKVCAWIADPYLHHPTFFHRYGRGIVFALRGLTVNIQPGKWKFDWQGRDNFCAK